MEIVVHVGAHKSASTALQAAILRHTQINSDVEYMCRDNSREFINYICKSGSREQEKHSLDQIVRDIVARALEAQRRDKRLLVISEENLLGPMLGLTKSFYPHIAQLRHVLDRVAQQFSVRVLIQIRRPSHFILSAHEFRVMAGSPLDLGQFIRSVDILSVDWLPVLDTLRKDAPYSFEILPVEALSRADCKPLVAKVLSFIDNAWDADCTPIPRTNERYHSLVTLALMEQSRRGKPVNWNRSSAINAAFTSQNASDTVNSLREVLLSSFERAKVRPEAGIVDSAIFQYKSTDSFGRNYLVDLLNSVTRASDLKILQQHLPFYPRDIWPLPD